MGQAGGQGAVEPHLAQGLQGVPELIAQPPQAFGSQLSIGHGPLQGRLQPHDQRYGQGAGPQPLLLAAAVLLGGHLHPRANQQGADALGAVALVAAEAEEVDAQLLHGQGGVAGGLGGVAVEQHAPLAAELGDRGQGRQHADLVIGGHGAEQQHIGLQGRLQLGQIRQTVGLYGQQGERKAMALQVAQRIQHGPMFSGQAHQPPPLAAGRQGRFRHAFDGEVVGFRGAAGEHHLGAASPQQLGDAAPGPLHRRRRRQARAVLAAGGVGELVAPPGGHRRHHGRIAGGGGVVVEVGLHGSMLNRRG